MSSQRQPINAYDPGFDESETFNQRRRTRKIFCGLAEAILLTSNTAKGVG